MNTPSWTLKRIAALLGLVLLFPFPAARADIVVPGYKGVENLSWIDLGPYARYTPRLYKIRKGDTLWALARDRLGSAKRVQEILDLNPGLTDKILPIGAEIMLPPPFEDGAAKVSPDGKKQAWPPRYYFFLYGLSFFKKGYYWGPKLLVHKGRLAHPKFGGRIFAVPHDKVKAFLARYGKKPQPGQAQWLLSADVPPPTLTVESESKISKVVSWYSIRGIKDGKIEITLKEQKFDGEGQKIAGFTNPLMLALAAMGLVGLAVQTLRRRRSASGHA